MPCAYTPEHLYVYLDGALAPAEAHAVALHLQTCIPCQQAVAAHRRLQAMLCLALEEDMPAQLWPAIQQQLGREAARTTAEARRPIRWRMWISGGAIAALLLFACIGRSWFTASSPAVVQEMVDSHIRTRLMIAPYTQVSTQPEAIQAWFQDKVEFAVPVPQLPQERYAFQGVRLNYFLNRRVAELAYTTDAHLLSFFIFAESGLPLASAHTIRAGTRTLYVQQRKGYTVILWKDGDLMCGLVSDLHATALLTLLQQVMPGAFAS
jgi:anti-sigma factor RsiW